MKRLVFSILSIVAVFSIAITGCLVARKLTTHVCEKINSYGEKISDQKQIASYGTEIETLWKKKEKILMAFMNHIRFKEADEKIAEIKYSETISEFRQNCRQATEIIRSISESEAPFLENFF